MVGWDSFKATRSQSVVCFSVFKLPTQLLETATRLYMVQELYRARTGFILVYVALHFLYRFGAHHFASTFICVEEQCEEFEVEEESRVEEEEVDRVGGM